MEAPRAISEQVSVVVNLYKVIPPKNVGPLSSARFPFISSLEAGALVRDPCFFWPSETPAHPPLTCHYHHRPASSAREFNGQGPNPFPQLYDRKRGFWKVLQKTVYHSTQLFEK